MLLEYIHSKLHVSPLDQVLINIGLLYYNIIKLCTTHITRMQYFLYKYHGNQTKPTGGVIEMI